MDAEELLVDARLVVEPFEVAGGDQGEEVAVATLIGRQEDQVVGLGQPDVVALVLVVRGSEIHFAAENRLHPVLLRGEEEIDRAEQVAMVGHRHRWHAQLRRLRTHLPHLHRPVEERVLGVAVEMDEGRAHGD